MNSYGFYPSPAGPVVDITRGSPFTLEDLGRALQHAMSAKARSGSEEAHRSSFIVDCFQDGNNGNYVLRVWAAIPSRLGT